MSSSKRLTRDGSLKCSPQVTARGTEVVFAVLSTPKLYRLMRLKLADQTLEPLHKEADRSELDPAFTADDRQEAFIQLRSGLSLALVIRDLEQGKDVEVPPPSGFAGLRSPALVPDGSRVLYSFAEGGGQQIYSVDKQGGDRRQLTPPSEFPGISNWPAVAPDGQRVVFSSSRYGTFDVHIMDLQSKKVKRLTNGPLRNVRPRFSADGRRIAFTSQRDGTARVCVMNADGSGVQCLETGSEGDDYPTWHPDGEHLVIVSEVHGQRDLYLVKAPP